MYERLRSRHVMQISLVDLRRFLTQQSRINLNTSGAQVSETFSRNLRIQILDRRDDSLDTGGDECVGTRCGTSVVRVRLERDVGGATACLLAGDVECDRL